MDSLRKPIGIVTSKNLDGDDIYTGIYGLDVIQFIITSQIAVHCVDYLELVLIDIFSCKDFETGDAQMFTQEWFEAKDVRNHIVYRD